MCPLFVSASQSAEDIAKVTLDITKLGSHLEVPHTNHIL